VFEIVICSSSIAGIGGISNYLLFAMARSLALWANESRELLPIALVT